VFHVKQPLTPAAFKDLAAVDSVAMERLSAYLTVLAKWQRSINLVGPESMNDPWRRHILDSAQLAPLLPDGAPAVVDFGSGAGLPGVVIAILSGLRVDLVESNARKCGFLREAARVSGAKVTIHNDRIGDLAPFNAGVITARACAPLTKLLDFAFLHLDNAGFSLFLKGHSAEAELTEAQKKWKMHAERISSKSDPRGVILKISAIRRRHDP
jgi:16S rRNA (guanine527-N7)-methyltransferase